MNKFTVFYSDGTNFSGNPLQRDWDKIDVVKQIIKLEYLYDKVSIVMEGYKQYNHLKEMHGMSRTGLAKIMLMGRTNNNTEIIVLDLKKNKIYKEFKPIYQEYGKQILRGWQKGMLMIPKSMWKTL